MSKIKQLMDECESRNLHCSITYQTINDYSVEIYRSANPGYDIVFYSDGHLTLKKAVKKGLKYISNHP